MNVLVFRNGKAFNMTNLVNISLGEFALFHGVYLRILFDHNSNLALILAAGLTVYPLGQLLFEVFRCTGAPSGHDGLQLIHVYFQTLQADSMELTLSMN